MRTKLGTVAFANTMWPTNFVGKQKISNMKKSEFSQKVSFGQH